jgi:hypothetical protein
MKPSELENQVARIMWEAAGLDYTAEDLCDRAPAAARAAIALVLKHAAEAARDSLDPDRFVMSGPAGVVSQAIAAILELGSQEQADAK